MLLSLSIGLMQKQVMEKVLWVAKELGMNGESSNEEIVKVHKERKVNATPAGMTGNELDFNEKRTGHVNSDDEEEDDSDDDDEEGLSDLDDLDDLEGLSDITEEDDV